MRHNQALDLTRCCRAGSGEVLKGMVIILDAESGEIRHRLKQQRKEMGTVLFSPDGNTLVVSEGYPEKEIHIWDTESGKLRHSVMPEQEDWVKVLAFSHDSKWLAFPDQDGAEIRIWDVEGGKEEWRYKAQNPRGGPHLIGDIQWVGDGKLAVIIRDGTYHMADVPHRKMEGMKSLMDSDQIWFGELAPDGRLVALGIDGTVHLWDAWTGDKLQTLAAHRRQVDCVAFSADGSRMASVNGAGEIRLKLWQLKPSGQVKNKFPERVEKKTPEQLERDAIIAIEKLDGHARRRTEEYSVSFHLTDITDSALVHLKALPNLKYLVFEDTKVTDAGLEHLRGLSILKDLSLTSTKVTDAGLEHIKGLTNLYALSLRNTQVTDAGLDHLKELTNLQDLSVDGTKVTDEGKKRLKAALPDVTF